MKTNWQDPGTSEIFSSNISGLQEAIGKIEDSIGLKTTAETGITLSEVYVTSTDRYRIFQVAEGKRNWVASPAPVIYKNSVEITTGFAIDYGGGAIILEAPALSTDAFTTDFTRTNNVSDVNTHLADYVRNPAFGQTAGGAGTPNAYTFSSNPALPALVDGASAYLDINVANTGAATLNWDGKGAKPIVNGKGAALTAGKLPANSIIGVRYNASAGNFQLLGEGGEYGTAGAAQTLAGYTVGTDNGLVNGAVPVNGSQTATLEITDSTKPTKAVPPGYTPGGTITAQLAAALASVIKEGTTVGGVLGTLKPYASPIKSVQRGSEQYSVYDTGLNIPINPVNVNNSIIFVDDPYLGHKYMEFVDSSTIRIHNLPTYSNSIKQSWQVVEFDNVKNKQEGTYQYTFNSNMYSDIPISEINMNKAILAFGNFAGTAGLSGNVWLYLINSTTLRLIYGTNGQTGTIKWQILEFD